MIKGGRLRLIFFVIIGVLVLFSFKYINMMSKVPTSNIKNSVPRLIEKETIVEPGNRKGVWAKVVRDDINDEIKSMENKENIERFDTSDQVLDSKAKDKVALKKVSKENVLDKTNLELFTKKVEKAKSLENRESKLLNGNELKSQEVKKNVPVSGEIEEDEDIEGTSGQVNNKAKNSSKIDIKLSGEQLDVKIDVKDEMDEKKEKVQATTTVTNNKNSQEKVFAKKDASKLREISTDEWLSKLERIVHIDLKGAPPKVDYLKQFIPLVKKLGATGILIEYEDTFPFEGELAEARYGFAYSKEDVATIKQIVKENGLKLIPLVQTYGHLEWLLKIKKFAHLREDSRYPQVITPCLNESYVVLYDMLDQVIEVHKDAEYFHIGCDEVYYKLVHPKCSNLLNKDFDDAFMSHLLKIASYVRSKLPRTKILFWDDMLHGMSVKKLENYKAELMKNEIKPMMWGYMPRVDVYFPSVYYEKYGRIFDSIWVATAFKGAQGELATVTNMHERMANHLSWVQVMKEKVNSGTLRFEGVALTGWSRYDHFLQLCELLPQAIPQLAVGLEALKSGGELSNKVKLDLEKNLGCSGSRQISYTNIARPATECKFPGHEIQELVVKYSNIVEQMKKDLEFAELYMSPISMFYNYAHKKRSSEIMAKLKPTYLTLIEFREKFQAACKPIYTEDTAIEWLTVYVDPYLDKIYRILDTISVQTKTNSWQPRPVPIKLKSYPKAKF